MSNQLYFSRASTLCAYGEMKTVAVRNRHEFAALPTLSFPHAEPPFSPEQKFRRLPSCRPCRGSCLRRATTSEPEAK
jgi:hypothetical protein